MKFVSKRLLEVRQAIGLSQEEMGDQGVMSFSGWVKIEKGRRNPSDELIGKFVNWLKKNKYIEPRSAKALEEELLALKYADHSSDYVRRLAKQNLEEEHGLTISRGKSIPIVEVPSSRSVPVKTRKKRSVGAN